MGSIQLVETCFLSTGDKESGLVSDSLLHVVSTNMVIICVYALPIRIQTPVSGYFISQHRAFKVTLQGSRHLFLALFNKLTCFPGPVVR